MACWLWRQGARLGALHRRRGNTGLRGDFPQSPRVELLALFPINFRRALDDPLRFCVANNPVDRSSVPPERLATPAYYAECSCTNSTIASTYASGCVACGT